MTQPLYSMRCPFFFLHFTCIMVNMFIMTNLFRIMSSVKTQFLFIVSRENIFDSKNKSLHKKFRVPKNVADNCMNYNIIPQHFGTSVLIQLSLLSNDINIFDCFFFIIDLPIPHIS